TVAVGTPPPAAAPWVAQDVRAALRDRGSLAPTLDGVALAALLAALDGGTLHAAGTREALRRVAAGEGTPAEVIARHALAVVDDADAVAAAVADVLAAHPDERAAYRAGKKGLLGFFVGQTMRATGGRADPKRVQAALAAALDGDD
ncbi:MAG: glutamine--tRNA ligase, partial [Trueperaceae bacterium]